MVPVAFPQGPTPGALEWADGLLGPGTGLPAISPVLELVMETSAHHKSLSVRVAHTRIFDYANFRAASLVVI